MDNQGQNAERYRDRESQELPAARGDFFRTDSRHFRPSQAPAQPLPPGAGNLVAMVCHELRSPLAALRYAIRLWGTHTPEAPERQKLLAMIERQTARMTRLIEDLLDVSRVSSERMRLNCERIDLRRVVGHAIETTAPDIDAAKHQLTAFAPEGPVWVSGDPFRLEQVFVNLLSNAAKYTGNGGRISIRMVIERRHAVIRVRDSGIGIPPEMLPHVFDLFRQVDETSPQSRSGLGVGLAIVRSLVELHGGYVDAASRGAGKGSDFTVRLPLAD